MKKVLIVAAVVAAFILASCTTSVVSLPDFAPLVPQRPTLTISGAEVSPEAYEAIVALMGYARELEAYGEGWREFYSELKELDNQ